MPSIKRTPAVLSFRLIPTVRRATQLSPSIILRSSFLLISTKFSVLLLSRNSVSLKVYNTFQWDFLPSVVHRAPCFPKASSKPLFMGRQSSSRNFFGVTLT